MSHWESPSKSDDWFTPPHVFEALGCTFDLDVAGNHRARVPTRGALYSGGLEADWNGFVWMNPPFGVRNSLGAWLRRFFDHGNGVALTPDRTSAPWFREAWPRADAVLFTPKLQFLRPDGTAGKSPSNGTALWAAGSAATLALHRAARAHLGVLGLPLDVAA